jgi:Phage integrase family
VASLVSDRLARKLRHLGDLLDADQIAVGGDGRPVNVVTCDCLPSFTIALSSGSITPPPCDPLGPNAQSGRAVAGACGYALANRGHDTRALQAYLGHKNIQHTVRYTELSPTRFKNFCDAADYFQDWENGCAVLSSKKSRGAICAALGKRPVRQEPLGARLTTPRPETAA